MPRNEIPVAGASGLVGFATIKRFMRLPDWEVVGFSRRVPTGLEHAQIISVDPSTGEAAPRSSPRCTTSRT
jgi:hypothetical protein